MPTWHDLLGFLPLAHDVEALFDGVGQRFLHVHVLARPQRGDGHVVMQVLRRHDEDRVDRRVRQQLAVVHVGLGCRPPDRGHAVLGARDVALVGIADRRDLHVVGRRRMHPVERRVSARAHPDPADIDLVVGCARRNEGRPGRQRRRRQKIPAIEFVRHETSTSDDTSTGFASAVRPLCYTIFGGADVDPLERGS